MPFRRIADYANITSLLVGMVFTFGILYSNLSENTKDIAENKKQYKKISDIEIQITSLSAQLNNQKEWQSEFMSTFKEMVAEIKHTNETVVDVNYRLKSIERKVDNAAK